MSKKGIAYVLVLFLLTVVLMIAGGAGKASVNHTHGPNGEYIELSR